MGGINHKPIFERLILCDNAIADLTNANVNAFYRLGIRHSGRPHSTLLLYVVGTIKRTLSRIKEKILTRLVEAKNPRLISQDLWYYIIT